VKDLASLETKLEVQFHNPDLLTQALVHRSYINENPGFKLGHNERLEYLGDAVLELVVSEYLYAHFDNPEGDLTNWRASLVNAKMLAEVAKEVGLDGYLLLSRGEAKDAQSKARQTILANAFEAVVGALYLDRGYGSAKEFVHRWVLPKLPHIISNHLYIDPKSRLQERAQELEGETPNYKVLDEWGPDHDKHFKVGVYFGRKKVGEGEGPSKQEAQVSAAENALEARGWQNGAGRPA
jgi:ribonuclease-3